jgi:hypothetical protein
MKTRSIALLVALLLVPSLALAKKPKTKGLSDADLIKMLSHDDEDYREAAAELLGEHKSDDAIPALTKLAIEDKESDVYVQAMWALEEIDTDAAWDGLQTIFETPEATEDIRQKALRKLMDKKLERADNGVPYYLLNYKDNSNPFNNQLLDALVKLDRKDMRDLPMLMVRDTRLKRPVRVNALDAVEALKHPGVVEAYIALLDDEDKKIKMRCIKGLSRAGLPADRVGPPLEEVVRTDKMGDVRAAALSALKMYVYPELLALVQPLVTTEKHPMAWANAVEIFAAVADSSSMGTLQRLLGPEMSVGDNYLVLLIQTAVRLGDPTIVPTLEGLRDRTESTEVAAECKNAIRLLSPEAKAERVTVVQSYVVPGVVYYDTAAVTYVAPEVSMTVSDSGTVVTSDGADVSASISLGGFYAGARVGGAHVSAHTGGSVVVTETTTVVEEGPCEPAELVVGQVEKVWYNLYVDGDLKIEARAFDDSKRVGGLTPGQYNIRVGQFMDNETWSEGLLQVRCGDVIKAEVREGSGLKVLNYPDAYRRQ